MGQEARSFQRQRKGEWERPLLAKALVERAGMTQREAAGVMGLTTGAAVSIQLRRLQQALPKDAQLRRQVRKIESHLEKNLFSSSTPTDLSAVANRYGDWLATALADWRQGRQTKKMSG